MPNSSEYELQALENLNQRAIDLVRDTAVAIAYTRARVRYGRGRVERARNTGFGSERIVLGRSAIPPTLVDAQIFDTPSDAVLLNQSADACSVCDSTMRPLVALVRFESLDLVLCDDCYQSLSDRVLGQVT